MFDKLWFLLTGYGEKVPFYHRLRLLFTSPQEEIEGEWPEHPDDLERMWKELGDDD